MTVSSADRIGRIDNSALYDCYSREMEIILNGQPREVSIDPQAATVDALIRALEMKTDRVAVERNGEIVRRDVWATTPVETGDRFEVVHFVGGGI